MEKEKNMSDNLRNKIKAVKRIKKTFNSDTQLFSFIHEEKEYVETEVITDWFDINQSENVTWLLVRLIDYDNRYKHIKLENAKSFKVITKNKRTQVRKGDVDVTV